MICKSCGYENAEGCVFCANCGASLEEAPAVEAVVEAPVVEAAPAKKDGMTIAALILGIAGLALALLCGCCGCAYVPLIVSIVGLVLGIVAFKKAKDAGVENKMALTALILSAAGCLVSLIGIILGSIVPSILAGMGVDLMGMDMLEDMMYMLR